MNSKSFKPQNRLPSSAVLVAYSQQTWVECPAPAPENCVSSKTVQTIQTGGAFLPLRRETKLHPCDKTIYEVGVKHAP